MAKKKRVVKKYFLHTKSGLNKCIKIEAVDYYAGAVETDPDLTGFSGVHVVDLITEGSSVYRIEDDTEEGWIAELRKKDAV